MAADSAAPAPPSRWWSFFNSQFGLWLLSSVVLSGITYYWNHRKDQQIATEKALERSLQSQREDSQFLVSLLSFLVSADRDTRLRAIDVVKARYADSSIPPSIQQLIANTVAVEAAAPRNEQTPQSKMLLASAAQVLDNIPKPNASVLAAIQKIPARVYIHIANEAQRPQAQQLVAALQQQGYLVPGIENVGDKAPREANIRYFNMTDQAAAETVAAIMRKQATPVQTGYIRGYENKVRAGSLEVWWAKGN